MNFRVVIPARFRSYRLMGKPLEDIGGKPMVVLVAEAAQKSKAEEVVVATDDLRIARICEKNNILPIMTSKHLRTGSDRVAEAVEILGWKGTVLNVQGDQPFVDPELINHVAEGLGQADVCTAAQDRAGGVRLIPGEPGRVAAFTRKHRQPSLFHIGIYAFSVAALSEFATLPSSPGELTEDLEPLRALDNGMQIRYVEYQGPLAPEVNTPRRSGLGQAIFATESGLDSSGSERLPSLPGRPLPE